MLHFNSVDCRKLQVTQCKITNQTLLMIGYAPNKIRQYYEGKNGYDILHHSSNNARD